MKAVVKKKKNDYCNCSAQDWPARWRRAQQQLILHGRHSAQIHTGHKQVAVVLLQVAPVKPRAKQNPAQKI